MAPSARRYGAAVRAAATSCAGWVARKTKSNAPGASGRAATARPGTTRDDCPSRTAKPRAVDRVRDGGVVGDHGGVDVALDQAAGDDATDAAAAHDEHPGGGALGHGSRIMPGRSERTGASIGGCGTSPRNAPSSPWRAPQPSAPCARRAASPRHSFRRRRLRRPPECALVAFAGSIRLTAAFAEPILDAWQRLSSPRRHWRAAWRSPTICAASTRDASASSSGGCELALACVRDVVRGRYRLPWKTVARAQRRARVLLVADRRRPGLRSAVRLSSTTPRCSAWCSAPSKLDLRRYCTWRGLDATRYFSG